jgi:hypothetical protein
VVPSSIWAFVLVSIIFNSEASIAVKIANKNAVFSGIVKDAVRVCDSKFPFASKNPMPSMGEFLVLGF